MVESNPAHQRHAAIANQVRRLTQVLFVSGALNILLLLAFLSLLYLDSPLLPFPAHSRTISPTAVSAPMAPRSPLPDLVAPTVKPLEIAAVAMKPTTAPTPAIPLAPPPVQTTAPIAVKPPPFTNKPASISTRLPCATYVVSEGDSLWKIARKYGVDVSTLKQINHLEGDRLKQGMVLSIPTKHPLAAL